MCPASLSCRPACTCSLSECLVIRLHSLSTPTPTLLSSRLPQPRSLVGMLRCISRSRSHTLALTLSLSHSAVPLPPLVGAQAAAGGNEELWPRPWCLPLPLSVTYPRAVSGFFQCGAKLLRAATLPPVISRNQSARACSTFQARGGPAGAVGRRLEAGRQGGRDGGAVAMCGLACPS
eukprot:2142459-Rhodomonas_salina.2